MICRKVIFAIIIIVGFTSCNTVKQLQQSIGFSDDCLQSYQYFKDRIARKGDDKLLEFVDPVSEVYQELLTEYENNIACWLDVLPEYAVVDLFGAPHVRSVGHRDQNVTLIYYIRTEECGSLEGLSRVDDKCGVLRFRFSKEGRPIGGIFYAWKPAKMK